MNASPNATLGKTGVSRRNSTDAPGRVNYAIGDSTRGKLLVATTADGLCALLLGDDAQTLLHELRCAYPKAQIEQGTAGSSAILARVIALAEKPSIGLTVQLDVAATEFQRRLWLARQGVQACETANYGDIVKGVVRRCAVRAVARACASDALAVVAPCHRVFARDGKLVGYRWSVDHKREPQRCEAQI
jgi:AraC family transcriptional regulator of adaptative response/methylated-DNA-[protein]-cysteine methyltransferase